MFVLQYQGYFFMYSNSYMAINMTVIAKTKDICRSFDYN